MLLDTKHSLNEQTLKKAQDLIRANIDAFDGFREAAEVIDNPAISEMFLQLASERSEMATELQSYVEWNGEAPREEGSFSARVHRAWLTARGKISGGDEYAVLAEAERGEDHIKHAYEDVLKETAGSAMNDVFLAQYAKVKAGHDRVRDLRDAFKKEK